MDHNDRSTEFFASHVPAEIDDLTAVVLELASSRSLSIATAESCTGGLLASLLTDVKGASGMFERGFVVYSDDSKCEVLGLDQGDIDRCGAVSEEVAVAMADGALQRSLADVAVSTTGFADDGPTPGLVHFACATRWGPTRSRREDFGAIGRGPVRLRSIHTALELLHDALDGAP